MRAPTGPPERESLGVAPAVPGGHAAMGRIRKSTGLARPRTKKAIEEAHDELLPHA